MNEQGEWRMPPILTRGSPFWLKSECPEYCQNSWQMFDSPLTCDFTLHLTIDTRKNVSDSDPPPKASAGATR